MEKDLQDYKIYLSSNFILKEYAYSNLYLRLDENNYQKNQDNS